MANVVVQIIRTGNDSVNNDLTELKGEAMPTADMPSLVFEVLRSAVNLARNEQIRNVAMLKRRLLDF